MSYQEVVTGVVTGSSIVCTFAARARPCQLLSLLIIGPGAATALNAWSPLYHDPFSLLTSTQATANNHAEFTYPHTLARGDQLYVEWAGVTSGSAVCTATYSDVQV